MMTMMPNKQRQFFLQIFIVVALNSPFAAATVESTNNRRNVITTQRSIAVISTIPRSILDLDRIDLNCPVECSCQRGYINCTSRFLRQIPSKNRRTNYTTFLPHAMWLNDNNFGATIAANNFTDWLMLKTLSLRNCSIRHVASFTFIAMPRLAILDLSFNQQGMIVDALAFSGTNLEALLLDDNPGIVFSEKSFENATIRSVRIRRCKLATISPDAFLPLVASIESLVASENQITGLSQRFEPLLTSISFFDVSKNPWICDCSVEWLVRVFVNRLNRTRSLNPVDEWGSASGHGLPVPTCVKPAQRKGMLIDKFRLGTTDFACTPASVIGIDVEQLREKNQTRFRCSAAGDPVAIVSWHFPRAEDEYHWALSVVENSTTVVSANAYSSSTSSGLVVVSQAFLTVINRPAVTVLNGFSISANQVRLVCKAANSLGSASLMTTFDVTQRNHEISQQPFISKADGEEMVTTGPSEWISSAESQQDQDESQQKLFSYIVGGAVTVTKGRSEFTTNIPLGYDLTASDKLFTNNDDGVIDVNATTIAALKKWAAEEGENVGLSQQTIPQGILVTVAVLVAVVMSSLGGCCLVIACSTSKVPNCPDLKRNPSRCRDGSFFLPPSNASLPQNAEIITQPHPRSSLQDRRPLLKPRYLSNDETNKLLQSNRPIVVLNNNNNNSSINNSQERRLSPSSTRRILCSPPQTFSTFRSATTAQMVEDNFNTNRQSRVDEPMPRPVLLNAFQSPAKAYTPPPIPATRDFEARNEANKRHCQTCYVSRGHHNNLGLALFLSPPPPPPPPAMDGITLNECGADINRNSSSSYPGADSMAHPVLSNSQSEICTGSPDFSKEKKTSSGYRSSEVNGGSEGGPDDLDASGGTSGVRSSEPGDEFTSIAHPVAYFSPVHDNDIIRKDSISSSAVIATAEEITFI